MRKPSFASSLLLWLLVFISVFGPLAMFLHWLEKRRISYYLKTRGAYPRY
jgi:hypothetical protein